MARFLLRNVGTKLLALAIGVFVWFFLSGQRRERTSERSYRIPLSIANIPPRTLISTALPGGVDVRVRGPFTALRQLEPEKLEAVIDLREGRTGEQVYRLSPDDINVPPEVEVIALVPLQVPITLDRVAEKVLPIVPDLTGEPAAGQKVVDVLVEPRVARVIGPATALERMTADPPHAAETLVSLCPVVFRSHWATLIEVTDGAPRPSFSTTLAPDLTPEIAARFTPFDTTHRTDLEADWSPGWGDTTAVVTPLTGDRVIVIGRLGGPAFLESEIARLHHLAALVK